ncbi:MAG: hypothetical protein IJY74_00030, partial [Oscillospiraceae bacterium]|nr:hypothetical protein [Oscillospiraceae bacterium]
MKKRFIPFLIAMMVCTAGCADSSEIYVSEEKPAENGNSASEASDALESTDSTESAETTEAADPAYADTASDMFTNRDYEVGYDETDAVEILLSGDTAVCSSDSVKI